MEGLLAALGDMERAMHTYPVKRYVDAQDNLYFVRGGLGGTFKGFRRYVNPKPGQRRESGIRALNYVTDFCQAHTVLFVTIRFVLCCDASFAGLLFSISGIYSVKIPSTRWSLQS